MAPPWWRPRSIVRKLVALECPGKLWHWRSRCGWHDTFHAFLETFRQRPNAKDRSGSLKLQWYDVMWQNTLCRDSAKLFSLCLFLSNPKDTCWLICWVCILYKEPGKCPKWKALQCILDLKTGKRNNGFSDFL